MGEAEFQNLFLKLFETVQVYFLLSTCHDCWPGLTNKRTQESGKVSVASLA